MSAPVQPLCRYCGKAIKKRTEMLWCYPEPLRTHSTDNRGVTTPLAVPRHRVGVFRTQAELQAVCNERVVSIRRAEDGTIWQASTWDGESYVDEYFCNADHARQFAYLFARHGSATQAYTAAVAKRAATDANGAAAAVAAGVAS